MRSGLETTFDLLIRTENRTAAGLLTTAMDCEDRNIRLRAVSAALERPDKQSREAVFERLDQLDPQIHSILIARGGVLAEAARHSLATDDAAVIEAVCERICAARLYDAIAPLMEEMRVCDERHRRSMADAVLQLTDALYSEIRDLHFESEDVQRALLLLRRRITPVLETGTRLWPDHRCDEVVEAYLLLAKPRDPTLDAILQHENDPVFEAVRRVLESSHRNGIVRLLLGYLSEPQIPRVIREVIAARGDLKFAESLLRSVGERPTPALRDKLKLLKGFQWAQPDHPVLRKLDDQSQSVAAEVFAATAADRDMVAQFVEHLSKSESVGGRRGAARALEHLDRVRAARLILTGLSDPDPEVRATMALQLRPRRVPQALILLVRMAEDPAPEVHAAVREALPEFRVRRFLKCFERISEDLLPVAGELIRKIDDVEGPVLLESEMQTESSLRRRRAADAAAAMGLVDQFETPLISLLADENHTVRKAAVTALSTARSRHAWRAVVDSLYDPSPVVQEAAEIGLHAIALSLRTAGMPSGDDGAAQAAPVPAGESVSMEPTAL